MNTLVIDTSYGSTIGVVGFNPIQDEDSRSHVEHLQVNIDKAIRESCLDINDINKVVVCQGPAPYTGLRSGIIAAKALAFVTKAEIIGQNSLYVQHALWNMTCGVPNRCKILASKMRSMNAAKTRDSIDDDIEGLESQSDIIVANTDNLNTHICRRTDIPTVYMTLALNDARRKQCYYTLLLTVENDIHDEDESIVKAELKRLVIGMKEICTVGFHHSTQILIPMNIDTPEHIVQQVQEILQLLVHSNVCNYHIMFQLAGTGIEKYSHIWDTILMYGENISEQTDLVDNSILAYGSEGLRLYSQDATLRNGLRQTDVDNLSHNVENNAMISQIVPIYLRRPDVEVPKPLKQVYYHADKKR